MSVVQGATSNDTSMRVRVACYDCGANIDQEYTVDRLAATASPPRCRKHERIHILIARKHALHELLMAEELDEAIGLLARTAYDSVVEQLTAARLA